MTDCACRSGKPYASCCEPLHLGAPAPSADKLMRSRYSAYALLKTDYLLATWLPDTRPASLHLETDLHWRNLRVLSCQQDADRARVHFIATWQEKDRWGQLSEQSRFERRGGRWYYRDGDAENTDLSVGRNTTCPCGSGRKYKQCCRP